MHRPLGEQQQHGRAHIAAPAPTAAAATTTEVRSEARPEPWAEARSEVGTVTVPAAAAEPLPWVEVLAARPLPGATSSEFSMSLVFHVSLLRLSCSFHIIDDISSMHRAQEWARKFRSDPCGRSGTVAAPFGAIGLPSIDPADIAAVAAVALAED
ncbi:hypothetical protein GCM10023319_14290 [Nocardia iowensis]